jgi:hypothetical protein
MKRLFLYCLFFLISHFGYCQSMTDTSSLRSIKIKLEALADRDQQYRTKANVNKMNAAQYTFGMKSREYKMVYDLITSNDSLDQMELIPILDKYGWLGKSQVGEKANEAIFYVVQHSNNEMRMKYIPLMRASVAKGESSELYLQWLEDRILLDQDKPTKYETQSFPVTRKDGTIDFYESRIRANEELRKDGRDTFTDPHPH